MLFCGNRDSAVLSRMGLGRWQRAVENLVGAVDIAAEVSLPRDRMARTAEGILQRAVTRRGMLPSITDFGRAAFH